MNLFARCAAAALAAVPVLMLTLFGGCAAETGSGSAIAIPAGMESMTFLVSGMT